MTDAPWTIDELTERVDAALAGGSYRGAPSGRVRDRPTTRTIRWYATIGLLDRPAAMRGRTAYYGRRHLLQLVAVKRRQAAGRTIAEIQAELAGAPDRVLAEIAEVPAELLDAGRPVGVPPERVSPARAAPAVRATRGGGRAAPEPADGSVADLPRPAGAFWTRRPAPAAPPDGSTGPAAPAAGGAAPPRRASTRRAAPVADGAGEPAALLFGVPLHEGAVLVLTAQPGHDDAAAIAVAARPLLDLLAARGLLPTPEKEYDR